MRSVTVLASLIELTMLGAIGPDGKITQIGRKMATLPLEPRQAKILLSSFVHNCTREIIDVLALLGSADQLLTVPQAHRDAAAIAREKFVHRNGDHLMLLNILRAYEEICQTMTAPKDRKAWCRDHFLCIKTLGNVIDSRDQIRARVDRMGADWKAASAKAEDMDAHIKDEAVLRCLLEGFRVNTAMKMADNSYRRINGSMVSDAANTAARTAI
jgi:HrpA-like RNA helicase